VRNLRIAVVSHHVPRSDGTAAGQALDALRTGLEAHGHDVTVHVWSFEPSPGALPRGTRWVTIDPGPALARRARALARPRTDAAQHVWERDLAPADLVIADDPVSWPAVEHARTVGDHDWAAVATIHYATRLDAAAVGRRALRDVQDRRAEWAVARRAPRLHAFSSRVAAEVGRWCDPDTVTAVPIAFDPGPPPPPPVDHPVAALLADWDWPPNRVAAARLVGLWPAVRDRVPGARLRLAGRGSLPIGTAPGIEVVGPVPDSREFLAEAAAVVFPCPASSGPKVKVLEAAAAGRPVVTSPAGVEGFAEATTATTAAGRPPDPQSRGAMVPAEDTDAAWVEAVTGVLADPAGRAALAAAGRRAVVSAHAPAAAAGLRLGDLVGP